MIIPKTPPTFTEWCKAHGMAPTWEECLERGWTPNKIGAVVTEWMDLMHAYITANRRPTAG